MIEFEIWVFLGLAGFGLLTIAIFFYNFLCAPFDIAEMGRLKAEAELEAIRPKQLVERLKTESSFPLWEAACLMAGTPVQRNPVGEASAYLHRLKRIIADDETQSFWKAQGKRLNISPEFEDIAVARISDDREIDRTYLKEICKQIGVEVHGFTDVNP